MRYVSFDLETTSLDPKATNILMASMVLEDTKDLKPLKDLPHFTCFVRQDEIVGDVGALAMNSWILRHLAGNCTSKHPTYSLVGAFSKMHEFLDRHFGSDRVTLAGANVGAFDYQFIKEAFKGRFRHRMIDVGSVFIDFSRESPMGLGEIKSSLGSDPKVSHNAYEDALDVIALLRNKY